MTSDESLLCFPAHQNFRPIPILVICSPGEKPTFLMHFFNKFLLLELRFMSLYLMNDLSIETTNQCS